MQKKTIRLACMLCDRDDCDGITHAGLRKAIKLGWKEVERVQTYRQACKVYENWEETPPDLSPTAWWTHLGYCPECAEIEEIQ